MTITVTQLNNYIRGLIDMDGVLSNLSVSGEVTNVKRYGEGWYFSLRDETGAINCFTYNVSQLEQGDVVIAEGTVNYFVKNGSVSFFVKRLTSTKNTGEAYLRFVELKGKLQKEGLFDDARKQPVPTFCSKVGIITSPTGAVIVDITNVALRRQPFCNLFLYPVKVQGVGADEEIVKGIDYFSDSDVDAVIVGRGGGSNEDLSVFNSEIIVRAIARCKKPVVSAVGHGVDFTLCDFVADKRAVTPSEAAEFVTTDVEVIKTHIKERLSRLLANITHQLEYNQQFVVNHQKRISSQVAYKVDKVQLAIKRNVERINYQVQAQLESNSLKLKSLVSKLSAVNPANILQRGFAFLTINGAVVKSVNQLNVGDVVNVKLSDGAITAQVTNKEKK